jgi:cyclohexanone monooxygenase
MNAYKGTTVPNFPNYFMIVGPNTGLGHSSMVLMIEAQVAYIRDALKTMRRGGYDVVEVDRATSDAYNRDLQQRMKRTVWSVGGCDSWYLDAHGKNTTLWPRSTWDFRRRLASFDPDAYTLSAAARPTAAREDVPA